MNKVRISNRDNNNQIKKQNIEIHNITQLIKVIIEAEKIHQSLQIQDEEDRHSIALWGMNKTKGKVDNIITKEEGTLRIDTSPHTQKPEYLMSKREYKNTSTSKNVKIKNSNTQTGILDLKFSPKINNDQNYKMLSQKSSNFGYKSSRKSQSVHKRAMNPIHFKRSLPEIIQTK